MKKLLLVSAVAVALAACASSPRELPVQQGVDLQAYAGTWYEQARLPASFQAQCAGDVRAEYVVRSDGGLDVTNQCRNADGTTKVATAEGRLARVGGQTDPARLEVRFAPAWTSWLPMVWGDYWIIQIEGDYQYALVGTPDRKYLWVLSRDKEGDPATIDKLLARAESLGFATDKVIRTEP